ncbi:hypothetical protein BCR37DRAFT_390301 [Protomyces lactucae-debilis]|uniref:Uncharacterized protein n=1 Tax=Protomyces lactucae-debilis TaxID=2754530 RepID=A0A1Y2FUY9_PROLT|nr:uncharacterized protein BCR37DRAFT_390301 [Protomyces lactucae-debilis]ORY87779.1 hypothetical protein BCR37DRAFT_390301 [Protomyces lactucae-debilis]
MFNFQKLNKQSLALAARQFSSSASRRDAATCQLLGKFGSTPARFETKAGQIGYRYLFAVNRGLGETQTTSWFNVSTFDKYAIERFEAEDFKGAKALINAAFSVSSTKNEDGTYTDLVNIRQTSMHIIARSQKRQAEQEQV